MGDLQDELQPDIPEFLFKINEDVISVTAVGVEILLGRALFWRSECTRFFDNLGYTSKLGNVKSLVLVSRRF